MLPRLFSVFGLGIICFAYMHWIGSVNLSHACIAGTGLMFVLFAIWGVECKCASPAQAGHGRSGQSKKSDFDWAMHYFRGFAITCIVILHYLRGLGWNRISQPTFSASTVFFLFISGYLCQYLAQKRPTPASIYYKKKVFNVITPYLIWSIITCLLVLAFRQERFGVVTLSNLHTLRGVIKVFLYGTAQNQYWYIPFVAFLFLFSPFILKFDGKRLAIVTIVMFFLSIIIPKRGFPFSLDWPNFVLMYTYFAVYYLLGFVYCRNKDAIDPYLKRYVWIAALFALFITIWLYRPGLFGLSLVTNSLARALQKLFITIVALVVLMPLRNVRITLLDMLAKYSFTLYFLHMFFVHDYVVLHNRIVAILGPIGNAGVLAVDMMLFVAFILQLLLLSIIMKTALGKSSRFFIGS